MTPPVGASCAASQAQIDLNLRWSAGASSHGSRKGRRAQSATARSTKHIETQPSKMIAQRHYHAVPSRGAIVHMLVKRSPRHPEEARHGNPLVVRRPASAPLAVFRGAAWTYASVAVPACDLPVHGADHCVCATNRRAHDAGSVFRVSAVLARPLSNPKGLHGMQRAETRPRQLPRKDQGRRKRRIRRTATTQVRVTGTIAMSGHVANGGLLTRSPIRVLMRIRLR
jgi:hypothetical protein